MSTLEIYELLKPKIGERESRALVEFVQETSRAAPEEPQREIRREIAQIREVMATKSDLEALRADLMKWMFLFWMGQVAAVAALIKVLIP